MSWVRDRNRLRIWYVINTDGNINRWERICVRKMHRKEKECGAGIYVFLPYETILKCYKFLVWFWYEGFKPPFTFKWTTALIMQLVRIGYEVQLTWAPCSPEYYEKHCSMIIKLQCFQTVKLIAIITIYTSFQHCWVLKQ